MSALVFVLRNLGRHRVRLAFTTLAVATAVVTFLLLRTTLWSFTATTAEGPQDRLATWNEVTYALPLPARHAARVRELDGVEAVTYATWFGGRLPRRPQELIATLAVDPEHYFDVYPELQVPPEQLRGWRDDPRGVIVGDALAASLGYRVGDPLHLEGTIFPGEWTFQVQGIYTTDRRTVDRNQILIRWDYLDRSVDQTHRGQISWIMSRVDPRRGVELSRAIDALFAHDVRTRTMTERAMQQYSLGNFAAVMQALELVSAILLVIIALVIGNTIAMAIRERVHEHGVLQAIGFPRRYFMALVLAESAVIGALGAALGAALGHLLVDESIGPVVEETMGSLFPHFRIPISAHLTAAGLAIAAAVLAGLRPALKVSRLRATDALRRTT